MITFSKANTTKVFIEFYQPFLSSFSLVISPSPLDVYQVVLMDIFYELQVLKEK